MESYQLVTKQASWHNNFERQHGEQCRLECKILKANR